jgi:hypothetical protein
VLRGDRREGGYASSVVVLDGKDGPPGRTFGRGGG